ncbi:MAG TPA: N-acetylmuramoyl-L-alanine amidase [Acidobacteriaceae bacterium]|jgi:N-acetylmuramoyl-L-alanine amidase|nr:N-acetylmuramoyl-L-alanine amidase [Acidobacteriaceae bacterium]
MHWTKIRTVWNPAFAAALAAVMTAGSQAQTAAPSPAPNPPPPVRSSMPTRFAVVLDPAHGGSDEGARLTSQVYEKDLVLTLANRLRAELTAHSIPVVLTRDSDTAVAPLNRAEVADHALAAACITLHATTSGSGIHLFSSSLTSIPMSSFLPWDTAQGAYTTQSLRLSSEIDTAMAQAEIPVTLARTALEPLDSFTCPAVVVEVAPLLHSNSATPLTDRDYQDKLVHALAAAIEQWQQDWRKGQ